jgi:hypothetical protein
MTSSFSPHSNNPYLQNAPFTSGGQQTGAFQSLSHNQSEIDPYAPSIVMDLLHVFH